MSGKFWGIIHGASEAQPCLGFAVFHTSWKEKWLYSEPYFRFTPSIARVFRLLCKRVPQPSKDVDLPHKLKFTHDKHYLIPNQASTDSKLLTVDPTFRLASSSPSRHDTSCSYWQRGEHTVVDVDMDEDAQ